MVGRQSFFKVMTFVYRRFWKLPKKFIGSMVVLKSFFSIGNYLLMR